MNKVDSVGAIGILNGFRNHRVLKPFERDSAIHLAAARGVYGATGEGDMVIATIGLALGAGGSLRMGAYLANVAGGIAVEQVGTATVTAATLQNILEDALPISVERSAR